MRMPDKAPQCFACLELLSDRDVSLDGGPTKHVCRKCWMKLPTFRRIQLASFHRSAEDGGLGLRDFLDRFMRAMDNAEEGNGPPIWPGRN